MCEEKRKADAHLRKIESSENSKCKVRDIEKLKEEIKTKQLNILRMRNKLVIAKRRLTYVFSFFSSSAASDHLQ